MVIYKITNLVNGKVYIGQTIKTVEKRFKEHYRNSNNSGILPLAIKKYGKENFKVEPICSSLKKEYLNELEIQLIKYCNSITPYGYNIVEGGNKGPTMVGKENPMYGKFGKLNPLYGRKQSKKFIDRVKITSAGKNNGMCGVKGKNHPSSKKIFCPTNNKIYYAIQDAAHELNLDPSRIVKVLKNKGKQTKGFTFIYLGEK